MRTISEPARYSRCRPHGAALVRLDQIDAPWAVVYAYPRTGVPDVDSPPGWDAIPGARGCTPQTCAYRDREAELQALGAAKV
jgi:peroxiredoxin